MLVHDLLRDLDSGLPSTAILDSVFEVEDILVALADIDKKIVHLKGLKEYRVQSISAEIDKLENRETTRRDLILRSLKQLEPNQKTFQFPDIGKVTRKSVAGSWVVEDEQAAIESLDKLGMKTRVVETKESINKRELKKVVAELAEQNKNVDGTTFKDGGESISIAFEGKDTTKTTKSSSVPRKSIDYLDTLEGQV